MGIVARQATWNTLLTMVGMGLGFVNMALLFPRLLSPAEFGLTRLIVSIAVVAAQVAQLGGEATVIRYFPYFRDRASGHRGLLGMAMAVATVGGFVAVLVLGLFHERFTAWFNDESGLYRTYGLVVLPMVLAEVYFLILRSFSRSIHRSIAPVFAREFLLRVLQTVLILAHALWHLSFALFLQLYVTTFVLTAGVVVFDLWRAGELTFGFSNMRIGRRMRRSMARYAIFTFGSGMAGIAVGNIDQVMVGVMLPDGLAHVAYYAVAMFFAGVITVPAKALMQPVVPLMAEAWRQRDMPKLGMLYHRTASIQFVIAAFIMLLLWSNVDAIFSFLAPNYAVGKPVLLILAVTHVVNMSTGMGSGIVGTSRSYWFDAVSGFVYLGLNVVLDYLFILWLGLIGVAWSSFVSVLVVVAWRVLFLRNRFNLWPYDGMTLRAAALIVALALLLGLLPHYGPPLLDIAWRSALLAALFWPAVHALGIAPELGAQVRKVLRLE